MKKVLFAVVLLVLATWRVAGAEEFFPPFSSQTIEGETITNAIFAEKKLTMVNIWATWCGPCISEMPDLGELSRSMPEGTQLVGILDDYTTDAVTKAKEIVNRTNANFPHIVAVPAMSSWLYTVDAIPTTIFVDTEGRIVGSRLVGSRSAAAYRAALNALLGEDETESAIALPLEIAGGSVTVDKTTAKVGETVTFTVIPDSGYELATITAHKTGDESTEVPLYCSGYICAMTMPAYPVTLSVSFYRTESSEHAITLPASVAGGSVTTDKTAATAGETVTLTIIPNSGYEFETIWAYKTGDSATEVPLNCTDNICTMIMPTYPVTVRVSFYRTESVSYAITLPVFVTGGRVTTNKTTATTGEPVTLTVIPNNGYELNVIQAFKTGDRNTEVPLYCTDYICAMTMPPHPVTVTVSFYIKRGSDIDDAESGKGGGCSVSGVGLFALAAGALLRKGKR
ncbi:MAG: redoxin family protein [Synergistaceae bacterium]|jgi:thiol-disulfide isomerase/thioredoxin|nr:redoxin family protein [Synergistaceae bacterium]